MGTEMCACSYNCITKPGLCLVGPFTKLVLTKTYLTVGASLLEYYIKLNVRD